MAEGSYFGGLFACVRWAFCGPCVVRLHASHVGDTEIALLWGRKQPFSVRTEEVTELFWLSEMDFHGILVEYPDMVVVMKTIARQRMERFNIPEK